MSGSGSYGWSDAFENDDDDFNDTEANSLLSKEYKSKDAVIFLIDASKSMWTPGPGADAKKPELHARNVLQLAMNFLKDKIIATRKDMVAFCFYNAREQKNDNAFRGIHIVNKLDEPDAAIVKALDKLMNPDTFEKTVGSCDAKAGGAKSEFYQALWTCSAMFAERELKDCTKRVFLFTDSDAPDGDNKDLQTKAKQKAKDLEDLDISIELFPMTYTGLRFDIKKFFKDLIAVDADEDVGKISENFSAKFEDLEQRFRKKEYKKRALATVAWQLRKDMEISVKMYCLVREAKPDTGSWLDSKTNNPLTCVTKWLCKSTGAHLEEHQMRKFYPYGGQRVFFTKEEVTAIKTFGEPGLTLMGFKPMKTLKVFHNIKPAYFIYPSEERIRGSSVAFNALLHEMVAANKYAVARLIYRRTGAPRFVAVVPQKEEVDKDGVQEKPPGMHMIFLPYADDVRSLKLPPSAIADADVILKAKEVVKKLEIKHFSPTDFENPSLQKHYANLQALALEEAAPAETEDLVQPDEKGMDKYAAQIAAFREAAGLGVGGGAAGDDDDDDEGGEAGAGAKRKAPSGGRGGGADGAPAAKKAKVAAAAGGGAGEKDWKNLVATGKIQKLTIPDLKDYCRLKGLPVGGKKADLVERVTKHVLK